MAAPFDELNSPQRRPLQYFPNALSMLRQQGAPQPWQPAPGHDDLADVYAAMERRRKAGGSALAQFGQRLPGVRPPTGNEGMPGLMPTGTTEPGKPTPRVSVVGGPKRGPLPADLAAASDADLVRMGASKDYNINNPANLKAKAPPAKSRIRLGELTITGDPDRSQVAEFMSRLPQTTIAGLGPADAGNDPALQEASQLAMQADINSQINRYRMARQTEEAVRKAAAGTAAATGYSLGAAAAPFLAAGAGPMALGAVGGLGGATGASVSQGRLPTFPEMLREGALGAAGGAVAKGLGRLGQAMGPMGRPLTAQGRVNQAMAVDSAPGGAMPGNRAPNPFTPARTIPDTPFETANTALTSTIDPPESALITSTVPGAPMSRPVGVSGAGSTFRPIGRPGNRLRRPPAENRYPVPEPVLTTQTLDLPEPLPDMTPMRRPLDPMGSARMDEIVEIERRFRAAQQAEMDDLARQAAPARPAVGGAASTAPGRPAPASSSPFASGVGSDLQSSAPRIFDVRSSDILRGDWSQQIPPSSPPPPPGSTVPGTPGVRDLQRSIPSARAQPIPSRLPLGEGRAPSSPGGTMDFGDLDAAFAEFGSGPPAQTAPGGPNALARRPPVAQPVPPRTPREYTPGSDFPTGPGGPAVPASPAGYAERMMPPQFQDPLATTVAGGRIAAQNRPQIPSPRPIQSPTTRPPNPGAPPSPAGPAPIPASLANSGPAMLERAPPSPAGPAPIPASLANSGPAMLERARFAPDPTRFAQNPMADPRMTNQPYRPGAGFTWGEFYSNPQLANPGYYGTDFPMIPFLDVSPVPPYQGLVMTPRVPPPMGRRPPAGAEPAPLPMNMVRRPPRK